jgi:hypothetical protein
MVINANDLKMTSLETENKFITEDVTNADMTKV